MQLYAFFFVTLDEVIIMTSVLVRDGNGGGCPQETAPRGALGVGVGAGTGGNFLSRLETRRGAGEYIPRPSTASPRVKKIIYIIKLGRASCWEIV